MSYKEQIIERLYYDIGEVAKMLGVQTSWIRFYEGEINFKVKRSIRPKHTVRKFTKEDIELFRLVKDLTEYCSVEGIRRLMRERRLERVAKVILEEKVVLENKRTDAVEN